MAATSHGQHSKKLKKQLVFLGFGDIGIICLLYCWVDFWIHFWTDFCWFWRSKITKKSSKNRSDWQLEIRCDVGWILDGSWVDFWWIWDQIGEQNGAKLALKSEGNRCQDDVEK